MAAVRVGGAWNWAKNVAATEWSQTKLLGRGARMWMDRRGPMMMGRAVRNTEMLTAMHRSGGWGAVRNTLGRAAAPGAMKGAMIGAGFSAGISMIDDARNGNFNSGSFGRALGSGLRGGLIGGAIGGVGGVGNAMFRGNMNRIARGPLPRPTVIPPSRVSRAMAASRSVGPVGAAAGMGSPMVGLPKLSGIPTSAMTRNLTSMGGRVGVGTAASRNRMRGGGMAGTMPGTAGPLVNLGRLG